MEDLIARLYPIGQSKIDYASIAAAAAGIDSPPDEDEEAKPQHALEECDKILQLTFSHEPKSGHGFLFGTDPNSCDIVLPQVTGISRQHCYLTFDSERRLFVRDCSKRGTVVTYDGQGGQKRRHFTWIIGGHWVPDTAETIVIQFRQDLQFQIVVSKPSSVTANYYDNVDRFLKHTAANASLPLGALGIQSNSSTAAHSGPHTPIKDRILLKQGTLGRGTFSVVKHVWDVSTGFEYASKEFHSCQRSDWKKEALLMHPLRHIHIVRLDAVIEKPEPHLLLEYLPLGTLRQQQEQRPISEDEVILTLQQGLWALKYLHELEPPVVHRDIKPENILVQCRDAFQIKLGDFGLSKASEDLKTLCGTPRYLAPELAQFRGPARVPGPVGNYTAAVDIWSLGVVIFELLYGLPIPGESAELSWCEQIVKQLNDCECNSLVDLLLSMVVTNPEERKSARECLEVALKLDFPTGPATPKPTQLCADAAVSPENRSTWELNELRLSRDVHRSADQTSQATVRLVGSSKRQRSPDENSDNNRKSGLLDNIRSWSTTTGGSKGVTYPSGLLDETNISGCAPPTCS